MADIYGVKLKMRKEGNNMFNIYDTIVVRKTLELGVIQGIMPRINKSKGFKYFVVLKKGKRFFNENEITKEYTKK